jgi:hypothetical protein
MLINLSNHPLSQWGTTQRREAEQRWGEVADMPFPKVDPTLSREALLPLVERYVAQCLQLGSRYGADTAFHVMGESVFCYHLVGRLLQAGYAVVASTTVRNVSYEEKGCKQSLFEFVRFRAY